jgi:peroxiredoxin Q/BCP
LNAKVIGVSRDDVITLRYWVKQLDVSVPILSNISGFLGEFFGVLRENQFVFERRTVIIDTKGTIHYVKDGSPDYEEIIEFLKKLNEEE